MGPKMAEGVAEFFSENANRDLIEHLRAAGVNLKEERSGPQRHEIRGENFCVYRHAGESVARGSRSAGRGAWRQSWPSVSKKTNYVVVGADPGSKFEKPNRSTSPFSTRRLRKIAGRALNAIRRGGDLKVPARTAHIRHGQSANLNSATFLSYNGIWRMSRVIAGRFSQELQAGGKSGLQPWRARKSRPRQGNAPGNARGLRHAAGEGAMAARLRKVPQKINRRCRLRLRGRFLAKPKTRLFRSGTLGKGEKVG